MRESDRDEVDSPDINELDVLSAAMLMRAPAATPGSAN
jgi:hypothetical protein